MDQVSSSSGLDSWPVPVLIYAGNEKLVKLSHLPKALKIRAWGEIRANSSDLADLLKEETLKQVVEMFSANIYIESHYAPCLPLEPLKGRKR